jgi:alkylation response protein AidB-like acyl-CoA dehydrogenase
MNQPASLFQLRLPPDDHPRRAEVRQWLSEHPAPTGADLLDAGYMVPHWSPPWGIYATASDMVIINSELQRAGVQRPPYKLARDFVGPLIMTSGTDEQRDRYIRPMLTGEEIWCELFSEPEAGSDLASLTTRATRDGDDYLISGVKTWTSQGHLAAFGLLLARTSADAPKHRGISCFICPMNAPGVTLQPVFSMEGEHKWNLVYLDDVRLSRGDLIGAENSGWQAARQVLANERMSMSAESGLAWGNGPSYADLLQLAQSLAVVTPLSSGQRERLAAGYAQEVALHVMRMQALGHVSHQELGEVIPEVRRTLGDEHGQAMLELWRDLYGPAGVALRPREDGTAPGSDAFADLYFFARALTLGGGTSEIQRNVIAERVLGLPREPRPAGQRPGDPAAGGLPEGNGRPASD